MSEEVVGKRRGVRAPSDAGSDDFAVETVSTHTAVLADKTNAPMIKRGGFSLEGNTSTVDDVASVETVVKVSSGNNANEPKFGRRSGKNEAVKEDKWSKDEIVADMKEIPDLEMEEEVDESGQAPTIRAQRVQALHELDDDAPDGVNLGLDGLDLSLLTSAMYPPNMLNEVDEPWDFDMLMLEVGSKMQDEQDELEVDEDDKKDTQITGKII